MRYLWCDRSPWMMPWGAHIFGLEVEKAREEGRKVRDIRFVRFKGANHFVSSVILGYQSDVVLRWYFSRTGTSLRRRCAHF